MRLWSIHPRYLDIKGLLACWREGLLARKVLLGQTKGYKNHPQLIRFRYHSDPVVTIDRYLYEILSEARRRGYQFDASKIGPEREVEKIPVTLGQLEYEIQHLKKKLTVRAPSVLEQIESEPEIKAHPLFIVIEGDVEPWEVLSD